MTDTRDRKPSAFVCRYPLTASCAMAFVGDDSSGTFFPVGAVADLPASIDSRLTKSMLAVAAWKKNPGDPLPLGWQFCRVADVFQHAGAPLFRVDD